MLLDFGGKWEVPKAKGRGSYCSLSRSYVHTLCTVRMVPLRKGAWLLWYAAVPGVGVDCYIRTYSVLGQTCHCPSWNLPSCATHHSQRSPPQYVPNGSKAQFTASHSLPVANPQLIRSPFAAYSQPIHGCCTVLYTVMILYPTVPVSIGAGQKK